MDLAARGLPFSRAPRCVGDRDPNSCIGNNNNTNSNNNSNNDDKNNESIAASLQFLWFLIPVVGSVGRLCWLIAYPLFCVWLLMFCLVVVSYQTFANRVRQERKDG